MTTAVDFEVKEGQDKQNQLKILPVVVIHVNNIS